MAAEAAAGRLFPVVVCASYLSPLGLDIHHHQRSPDMPQLEQSGSAARAPAMARGLYALRHCVEFFAMAWRPREWPGHDGLREADGASSVAEALAAAVAAAVV